MSRGEAAGHASSFKQILFPAGAGGKNVAAPVAAKLDVAHLGAKNWLFVGSELAGQRAAIVMSLLQSAKLNKIDPWAYLLDVLAGIHSHPASRIDDLLPHQWRPS